MRKTFFTDHPWELARPRMVLENDGKDAEKDDWSKIIQPHKKLSGESVVQRQLWLLKNQDMGPSRAYDHARKEFYALRLQEDVERRVAKEEALATGAYFGISALEIGMKVEDKEYERWKSWAEQKLIEKEQRRFARFGGVDNAVPADPLIDEEVASSTTNEDEAV